MDDQKTLVSTSSKQLANQDPIVASSTQSSSTRPDITFIDPDSQAVLLTTNELDTDLAPDKFSSLRSPQRQLEQSEDPFLGIVLAFTLFLSAVIVIYGLARYFKKRM